MSNKKHLFRILDNALQADNDTIDGFSSNIDLSDLDDGNTSDSEPSEDESLYDSRELLPQSNVSRLRPDQWFLNIFRYELMKSVFVLEVINNFCLPLSLADI